MITFQLFSENLLQTGEASLKYPIAEKINKTVLFNFFDTQFFLRKVFDN